NLMVSAKKRHTVDIDESNVATSLYPSTTSRRTWAKHTLGAKRRTTRKYEAAQTTMLAQTRSGNFTTLRRAKRQERTAPTEKPYSAGATRRPTQRFRIVM